jgi:hypothetical protein
MQKGPTGPVLEIQAVEREKVKSEDSEQVTFVSRVRFLYPHLARNVFAIPNGGQRNLKLAAQLKKAGVLKGAPDLVVAVVVAPWHGLFIEMKRRRGGAVSEEQREVHAALRAQGYRVEVAQGVDEAWGIFEGYIQQGKEVKYG